MSVATMIVEGVVKPDGTLEVLEKLDLPAGRVQVTVRSVTEPTQPDRFWKMMESLWADLRSGGRAPRTREEIDAEIDALRNEADEQMQAVERLQEECRRAGEQDGGRRSALADGLPGRQPGHLPDRATRRPRAEGHGASGRVAGER